MDFATIEKQPPVGSYFDVKSQLQRHIFDRSLACMAAGDAARDAITKLPQLHKRQQAVRRFVRQFLRGLPGGGGKKAPLNPQITGVIQADGYRIEKIIFESRPQNYVTANLYLPGDLREGEPRAAVQFLCGHSEDGRMYAAYQGVCQTLVQAGLIVLAQDPIGQGERVNYADTAAVRWGTQEHDHAGVQCQPLGDCLARYFLHDAMRGVDYLCSRPEVDSTRIGVTGNSGGGTQTALLMMADERIAAAAPGTYVTSREAYLWSGQAQDAEQIWPGFTAAGFDHEDFLLAMCPRPVRVLAVEYDFFPIEGARRTVDRCKRFWKLAGQPKNVDLATDVSVHCYTPKLACDAAAFFARHLLGKKRRPAPPTIAPFTHEQLRCTRSGQVRGELAGARSVYEENLDRLAALPKLPKVASQRAVAWLKRRVMAHRQRCPLALRIPWKQTVDKLDVTAGFWFTQPNLCNEGLLFQSPRRAGGPTPATIAVWDGGCSKLEPHRAWIKRRCAAGHAVLVLDVSGVGHLTPNPYNVYPVDKFYGVLHRMQDDLTWLDDDFAALRTYDVLRAVELLASHWPGLEISDIHLYAHGREGLYAQLAAPLDRRIKRLEVTGGLGSYAELVRTRLYDSTNIKPLILRDILQYTDLPQLQPAGQSR